MIDLSPFRASFLKASTFAERAFDAMEFLHTQDSWDRPPGVKSLIEEILPLAIFVRFFDLQQRRVRCRYYGGEHPFDAKLKLEGVVVGQNGTEDEYFVEVTSAVSPTDHLHREALGRYGSSLGDNRRVGSRARGTADVESRLIVRHSDAAYHDIIEWVRNAIRSKSRMQYPDPCILIVRAEPEAILHPHEWYRLAVEVHESLDDNISFRHLFVVQTSQGHVLQIL